MEHLEKIREKLICMVCEHIEDFDEIDTKELGEVIDMIKDIEAAMYYETMCECKSTTKETTPTT